MQAQRFRYRFAGQAGSPPPALVLTESPVPNESRVDFVRVIPVVFFPLGSFVASANWMFGFEASPFHASGTAFWSSLAAEWWWSPTVDSATR